MSRPAAPEPRPGFALFVGAFLLSPLVLACWAAAQGVLKVTGWPRWRVGAAAVAGGALVIWIQGGPVPALAAHLLGTWQWSLESDWYKQQATLALRLACSAPGPPVDSMAELVRRMDLPTLARLWGKHPTEAALVKMLTPDLPSICIRLANLAAAIAGRLDGTVAIGEQDLCIVSLLMMAHREDGESLFRVLMADVGHWISVRKGSRPALLVVDEFSAVSGARAGAIDVMERGRSFGVPSLLSGQSYASLGSPEEADRIVSAAATVALFASNTPEDLARLAGSVQTMESVLQAEDGRWTGRASVTTRSRHRVDPNSVRQLQPGQAVVISGGRAERIQVIQAPGANNGLALPRRPFAIASRVPDPPSSPQARRRPTPGRLLPRLTRRRRPRPGTRVAPGGARATPARRSRQPGGPGHGRGRLGRLARPGAAGGGPRPGAGRCDRGR